MMSNPSQASMTKRQNSSGTRRWQFSVEVDAGLPFPFDMLRYDGCWPATQKDAQELGLGRAEQVELVGIRPPTEARWRSFGWRLTECDTYTV